MYAKESDLQVQVCNLLDLILPENSVYHHSPNESQGNKPQFYKKLKRMGFKPGWCDLEIITPGKPAIFIELKRPGNYATIIQKEVHTLLKSAGALVFICKSLKDVYQALKSVLDLKRNGMVTAMLMHEETMLNDLFQMRKNKKQKDVSWYQNNSRKRDRKKKELSLS